MQSLTADTQALLLLTSYFNKPSDDVPKPLTPTQWSRLASWLAKNNLSPSTLIKNNPIEVMKGWQDDQITIDHLLFLLQRGVMLAVAIEKWQRAGIWVITYLDHLYPQRFLQRLGALAPAVLYGCGDKSLLNAGGLAVVGSRNVSDEDLNFATTLGEVMASMNKVIISGGARGVDQAAMRGTLQAGGSAVGVLANNLLQSALAKDNRTAITNKNLTLISTYYPESGFTPGNAMGRNKYIYCLADTAIVVHAGISGGTFSGGLENLSKRWVPLWVKNTDDPKAGNAELVNQEAHYLPDDLLQRNDLGFLFELKVKPPISFEEFFNQLSSILKTGSKSLKELQEMMDLPSSQLKNHLNQSLIENLIEKTKRPVKYRLPQSISQLSLFPDENLP